MWIALAIVAAVVAYTIMEVRAHARKSRQQWDEVDKSKLRKWNDEDD